MPECENAIWYGDVPNKRCVRVREGGEVLQTIHLDRGCFACMLGGADKRTLFLIANDWHGTANMAGGSRMGQVLTAEAPAPGVGWPWETVHFGASRRPAASSRCNASGPPRVVAGLGTCAPRYGPNVPKSIARFLATTFEALY